MDLSIVVVNWNTRQLLLDCLGAIYATINEIAFEVWLVDNASGDGSVEAVQASYPHVKIIRNPQNLGFAAANNKAFRQMAGRYALLLNTDAVLTPGAVARLFHFLEGHPEAAMACGQLLNRDGSKQNSIANFPSLLSLLCNETVLRLLFPGRFPSKRRNYLQPLAVESCIGACLLVRKRAIDAVGLLDERYFFFLEETDWALSMHKAGWKSYFIPDARIYHLQGQSTSNQLKSRLLFYRSRYLYFRKWYPLTFWLAYLFVGGRLLVNTALNLFAALLTLGMHEQSRRKLLIYGGLLGWHARGCPNS